MQVVVNTTATPDSMSWDGTQYSLSPAASPPPSPPPASSGLNWKGAWSASTAYAVDDAVSLNGSSYICLVANTNSSPATSTTNWGMLAKAGATGAKGAQGIQGIQGIQGLQGIQGPEGPPGPAGGGSGGSSVPATVLQPVYPQQFGAKADGVTDDTAAFQAAIDAMTKNYNILDMVIPPVPAANGSYLLKGNLTIQPDQSRGANQLRVRINSFGDVANIWWAGSGSFLTLTGLMESRIEGLNVLFDPSVKNSVAWDFVPQAWAPSMNNSTFTRNRIQFGTGGNNVGVRLGQNAGYSDMAVFTWDGLEIIGVLAPGDVGVQVGGSQVIPLLFTGCGWSQLATAFLSGPRLANGETWQTYTGADNMTFVNCAASNNVQDYQLLSGGRFNFFGGRLEMGGRAFQIGAGASAATSQLYVNGVTLQSYKEPADGLGVFYMTSSDNLVLEALNATTIDASGNGVLLSPKFINMAYSNSALSVRGCCFMGNDPFYTVQGDTLVEVKHVQLIGTDGAFKGWAAEK
jgi:hypothetical protein